MRGNRPSGFTIVATLSVVVFLLGLLGVLIINASKLNQQIKNNIQVTVFFQTDCKDSEAQSISDSLSKLPFVSKYKFISSEDAVFNFKNEIGEDFVDILGNNPLPASVELNVFSEYTNEENLQSIDRELSALRGVLEVSYPQNVFQQIDKNRRIISIWLVALSIILIIVAVVLISNTIRILIYSDRFIIKNQQLIGATERFILKPYNRKALKWTVLSFIFGTLLLGVIIWLVLMWLKVSMDINMVAIKQHFTESWYQYILMLFLLLLGGIIVVYLTTQISLKKYLNTHTDNLYN